MEISKVSDITNVESTTTSWQYFLEIFTVQRNDDSDGLSHR